MNSDVIRLLPDSVANQIAAGEVIQRPASVVKELVENAIDAGATAITIVVKDAGRTLIQVIDNGCGMSPTDARMAFERHATSKISSASDLYSLHTMGFRGEALASIAAVAQIDMRTMRRDDKIGTRLTVSESRFEAQEPVVCAPGTNLMVKNLFFHTPGRRRFLKKDSVELSHIMHEFERMALVNTTVEFTMIHNDTTLHKFMSGTFKQRIGSLFGKNLEKGLVRDGFLLKAVTVGEDGYTMDDVLVHDAHTTSNFLHQQLAMMDGYDLPLALGVIRDVDSLTYNDEVHRQVSEVVAKKGFTSLRDMILAGETWEVK